MSYLLIGLSGPELEPREIEWLEQPQVAGVVLFTRNFQSPDQLLALNADIRRYCGSNTLICVDQEGGRVQRFGLPCTRLPALGTLGDLYDRDRNLALELALTHARLMASEMRALEVDLSFAPVLDINGCSEVIGDRALHADPQAVAQLGRAYIKGLHEAGMAACGKHFPGHGSVAEDTHHAVASDRRNWDAIAASDLRPFTLLMRESLDAVMMAHVSYPAVCRDPAGFSPTWIGQVLRQRLGYQGIVISDDLGMRAAEQAGSFSQRIIASLEAGCDLVLVCRPSDVEQTMACELPRWQSRAHGLGGRNRLVWEEFSNSTERAAMVAALAPIQTTL
ncbi:MAG: beta-N-acetylhexosaminidase [Xanthomonadales bacterium]|nr:beta-N-acetylhexosaminidase [Xanthomonadales bacterium]